MKKIMVALVGLARLTGMAVPTYAAGLDPALKAFVDGYTAKGEFYVVRVWPRTRTSPV